MIQTLQEEVLKTTESRGQGQGTYREEQRLITDFPSKIPQTRRQGSNNFKALEVKTLST